MTDRAATASSSVARIEAAVAVLLLLCFGLMGFAFRSAQRRALSAEASRDELLSRFDRRLMAVMAADVTGYSRLMESDEEGTLSRLNALRDVSDPLIERHGGRITNTAGDSILAVFPSALAAVDCAVEMQTGSDRPAEKRLSLRIGINVGDVIEQRGDVFGDTVNIAARLEALAQPGGICVSRAVHDHVNKQRKLTFENIGQQPVKNIADPVSVFAIRL